MQPSETNQFPPERHWKLNRLLSRTRTCFKTRLKKVNVVRVASQRRTTVIQAVLNTSLLLDCETSVSISRPRLKKALDSETQNHPKKRLRDLSQAIPRFRDRAKLCLYQDHSKERNSNRRQRRSLLSRCIKTINYRYDEVFKPRETLYKHY